MAELEIKPSAAALTRVNVVLLIAAGITLTLVYLLTGGGSDLFSPKATLYTFVPDATGLAKASEVRLSGITIGAVSKVELSDYLDRQKVVRIDMRVKDAFLKNIPSDSQTTITADTLIGYQFVSIEEGKSPIPISENGTLSSEPVKQWAERADLILGLRSELQQVDDLLAQISSGKTAIGRFVVGQAEYDLVLDRISAFDHAVHDFIGTGSVVGQALFSSKLYTQMRTPLLNADNALAAIQRGEGAGGHLFASDEQYNSILRQLHDLRTMLAGLIPSLLQDDAGYRKVQKMLAATDAAISALNAGQGEIGQLLKNPQLYENLNGSIRDLQELLRDVRENPRKYLRYKVF